MHKAFADWYQIAAIQPPPEMLSKRWSTVETLAQSAGRATIFGLVQLVRGTCPSDAAIRTTINEAARKADPSFSARSNDAELRILAGATLVEILGASSHQADTAALALVTMTLHSTLGDELLNDFLAYARQYLANEAVAVRAASERPATTDSPNLDTVLAVLHKAIKASANHHALAEPAASAIKDAAAVISKMVDGLGRQVYRELDALREESNMFWWVFAGRSRDLGKSFRDLGLAASSLVAAKELADLTTLFPGPRSAQALLERLLQDVGSEAATSKISEAVNATDRDWRTRWIAEFQPAPVRETTPILAAAQRSLETDDPKDWISSFTKAVGTGDIVLPVGVLAAQAYLECILVRVAKKLED